MSVDTHRPVTAEELQAILLNTVRARFRDTLHRQCEWESAIAYAEGHAAGIEFARKLLDKEIAEAMRPTHTAHEVVQDYLAYRNRVSRRAPIVERPDYRGGPVDFETGAPA